MDHTIESLLQNIKDKINVYIDSVGSKSTGASGWVGGMAKGQLKKYVNKQIDALPTLVQTGGAAKLVRSLMKNPIVSRNTDLQKQIGAAYWTIKVAVAPVAERSQIVDQLLNATCPDPNHREKIANAMAQQCADYSCGPETYGKIFNQVDAACWVALVEQE